MQERETLAISAALPLDVAHPSSVIKTPTGPWLV